MLVCASSVRNCTRDRGCSAHPVFPAPSVFEREQTKMQNSGDQRRKIAKLYPTWPRSASLPAVTVAVRLKAVLMILERRFIEPDFSAETRRGRRPVGALCQ